VNKFDFLTQPSVTNAIGCGPDRGREPAPNNDKDSGLSVVGSV
jgi:hypothetical protein